MHTADSPGSPNHPRHWCFANAVIMSAAHTSTHKLCVLYTANSIGGYISPTCKIPTNKERFAARVSLNPALGTEQGVAPRQATFSPHSQAN